MINKKVCSMKNMLALIGCLSVCLFSMNVQASEEKTTIDNKETVSSDVVTVDPKLLSKERETNKAVSDFHKKLSGSKRDTGIYSSRSLYELSIRKAALTAIERNLSVVRSKIGQKIADQALLEAKAVFDPVFSYSLNTSKSRKFERTEKPDKYKRGTELVGGNHQIVMSAASPVSYLQYNAERPEGFYNTTVKASEKSILDPNVTSYLSTSIYQKLPWGNTLSLNMTTTYKDNKWVENNDVTGSETVGSYKRPWTSSLAMNVAVPLPFTKGFGEDNADHLAINTARLSNRVALWNVRSIVNDTLLSVDSAYWDLVSSVQQLRNATKIRGLAAKLLSKTKKMYDLHEITSADKAQVEGQYENIKAREETAFRNYMTVSNNLHRMLDLDENVMLIPVGYSGGVKDSFVEPENADFTLDNPKVKIAALYLDMSRMSRGYYKNQTRPTVSITGGISGSQSNAAFGYSDYGESFQHLFDPDSVVTTAGVALSRPVFNDVAEEALFQAKEDVARKKVLREQVSDNLRNTFNSAKVALRSSEESIKISKRNLKLAKSIYERALRFQKIRGVTEYEVTEKLISLLNAENSFVLSNIAMKKAESNLLASVGMLSTRYGERTAQTDIDRNRVKALVKGSSVQMLGALSGGNAL